jgi:hypothetical protein
MLGNWLDAARNKANGFKWALYVVLAVLVCLNVGIVPHHPHFFGEGMPGFWAVFALCATVAMVVVLKKIVYPRLARPEEDSNDRS